MLLGLRRHLRPVAGGPWRPDARPAGFPGRRRGAGFEAVDVRPYSDGDDLRHLDRNVTARTGVPHVRSYREERGATVVLVADLRRAMFWGTRRALRSVAAVEALALCGWRAVEAGGRVGLYAFGGGEDRYAPPRGRVSGMAAIAGGLAEAHGRALAAGASPAPDPDLGAALEAAGGLAPLGATLVLATALDDPGPDVPRLAEALARIGRLRVVLVRDAFQIAPPPGRYPYLAADGRRRWAEVGARAPGAEVGARAPGSEVGARAPGIEVGARSPGIEVGARAPRADADRSALERLGVPVLGLDGRDDPETMARAWDRFDGPVR